MMQNQTIAKGSFESGNLARRAMAQNKNYSPWRMLGSSTFTFIKYYIFGRFFLLGWWGFINCVNIAFFRFMKFARYYELSHSSENADVTLDRS